MEIGGYKLPRYTDTPLPLNSVISIFSEVSTLYCITIFDLYLPKNIGMFLFPPRPLPPKKTKRMAGPKFGSSPVASTLFSRCRAVGVFGGAKKTSSPKTIQATLLTLVGRFFSGPTSCPEGGTEGRDCLTV